MNDTSVDLSLRLPGFPSLPGWALPSRTRTTEEAVFASGAALASLHLALSVPEIPLDLLRDRMALTAAAACVTLTGRTESAAQLRDELHLLRPGDQPGPAGAVHDLWRRAVARPVAPRILAGMMPEPLQPGVPVWLAAAQGSPVERAAGVLGAVLADHPRAEAPALILAEAALARACGWDRIVPLLSLGLRRGHLKAGADLVHTCHQILPQAVAQTLQSAQDLTRRAARLRAVAPRLRAKGAAEAVQLFLCRDALAPTALTHLMSDRAARRLCDRLVDLGVVRELTGRASFRLYGV